MSKTNASESYCSLYTFVKKHNVDLYNILEDMCAIGLFRPRYPTTFLNPGNDLTKKLTSMVEKGHSEDAFEKLQSLFVFGKHNTIKEDAVSYNRKNYSDISIFKGLEENKHYAPWKSRTSEISVLDFNKKDFPSEGNPATPVLAKKTKSKKGSSSRKSGGKSGGDSSSESECDDDDMKTHATQKLIKHLNNDKKIFIRAVNSLLEFMSAKKNYNEIKMKVDPNMVLSWFILVKPNSNIENKLISDSDFNLWYNGYKEQIHLKDDSFEHIKDVFNSGVSNDKLKSVSDERKKLDTAGFSNTIKNVKNVYKNNLVELLEDELRFRFSNDIDMGATEILPLMNLNWEDPSESMVLFKEPSASCLYKPQLHELMCEFIKSNAFKYTIIKDDLYEKLMKSAGISGGSVGSGNTINIFGGVHRNIIKNMKKKNPMGKFVNSLNERQLKELKEAIERR